MSFSLIISLLLFFFFVLIPLISPSITQWSSGTPNMPYGSSSWVIGYFESTETVWFLGGYTNRYGDDVMSFDIQTNTFNDTHTDLSQIIFSLECKSKVFATIDRYIYFAIDGAISRYDMSSNTLTFQLTSMIYEVDDPCVATDGQYLFVAGGSTYTYFQIFNISESTWIIGPELLQVRWSSSCEVVNGYLYVIAGGTSTSDFLNTILKIDVSDVADINSNAWISLSPTLSSVRAYVRTTVVGELIYIVGGKISSSTVTDTVEIFDPTYETIVITTLLPSTLASVSIVYANNRLYEFGGWGVNGSTDRVDTWYYSNVITTSSPTSFVTYIPTSFPSEDTSSPTNDPTGVPNNSPTVPTITPSGSPTGSPTGVPNNSPTVPSINPTGSPTRSPTGVPNTSPTVPTINPSGSPTANPTRVPNNSPTVPTITPSGSPTRNPTRVPNTSPTVPTIYPSGSPTGSPTGVPNNSPTVPIPTINPSESPTASPTGFPSIDPSGNPTKSPSVSPSNNSSISPTSMPTLSPTPAPISLNNCTFEFDFIVYGVSDLSASDFLTDNNLLNQTLYILNTLMIERITTSLIYGIDEYTDDFSHEFELNSLQITTKDSYTNGGTLIDFQVCVSRLVFEDIIKIEITTRSEEYQAYSKIKLKEYLSSDPNGYSALDTSNLEIVINGDNSNSTKSPTTSSPTMSTSITFATTTISDSNPVASNENNTDSMAIIIPTVVLSIVFMICFLGLYYVYYKRKKRKEESMNPFRNSTAGGFDHRVRSVDDSFQNLNAQKSTEGETEDGCNVVYSEEGAVNNIQLASPEIPTQLATLY